MKNTKKMTKYKMAAVCLKKVISASEKVITISKVSKPLQKGSWPLKKWLQPQ